MSPVTHTQNKVKSEAKTQQPLPRQQVLITVVSLLALAKSAEAYIPTGCPADLEFAQNSIKMFELIDSYKYVIILGIFLSVVIFEMITKMKAQRDMCLLPH